MEYRCVAASLTGFVQQLAVHYLAHGYWFFVQSRIPDDKDLASIDAKLIAKYGIGLSRQSRARRKAMGIANVHYIRYERTFVLLATHGHHPFYDAEGQSIRDARRVPIIFEGYSLSVKKGGFLRKLNPADPPIHDDRWRTRVQICRTEYERMKAYFLERSLVSSADLLATELFTVPYEPYAPVRQQMLNILRLVNDKRRAAGLERLGPEVIRYRRQIVKPFDVSVGRAAP